MKKFKTVTISFAIISIGFLLLKKHFSVSSNLNVPALNYLELSILEDLRVLEKKNKIPIEFFQVKEIYFLDNRIKKDPPLNFDKAQYPLITKSSQGRYILQIELFESMIADQTDTTYMVLHLYDLEKNKISELSREYKKK